MRIDYASTRQKSGSFLLVCLKPGLPWDRDMTLKQHSDNQSAWKGTEALKSETEWSLARESQV
jgi:hypothetical protein